jgi:conjugative transfer signal peptidase TraF
MRDRPNWPATPAGEKLRRTVARRLQGRRRMKLLSLAGLAAGPAAASACWNVPTLLVWNASASAPVGLYAVSRRSAVLPGDMVIAWAPGPARSLAASRLYLPANVPLVKRVAAVASDRVCADGPEIRINGRLAAARLKRDRSGRPMPWWEGCRRIGPGDAFLLTDSALSFDGRYFGITRKRDLVGRAKLLWAP